MAIYSLGERKVAFRGEEWFIADNATVIGTVVLHNQASVWFNAVVRGDNDIITIGERTNIQDAAVLHVDPRVPLTLGKNVSVGHQAMLHGCTIGDGRLAGQSRARAYARRKGWASGERRHLRPALEALPRAAQALAAQSRRRRTALKPQNEKGQAQRFPPHCCSDPSSTLSDESRTFDTRHA